MARAAFTRSGRLRLASWSAVAAGVLAVAVAVGYVAVPSATNRSVQPDRPAPGGTGDRPSAGSAMDWSDEAGWAFARRGGEAGGEGRGQRGGQSGGTRGGRGGTNTADALGGGFVFDRGRYVRFAVPNARAGATPLGINDRGVVVGKYNDGTAGSGPGASEHGFVRDERGRFTSFDVPGARSTSPTRINDRGQIAGIYSETTGRVGDDPHRRGFLLDRGRFVRIDIPGATYTQPFGLNDRGQLVGEYQDAAGAFHAFRWDRGRLTTVDMPGAAGTTALGINDNGDIVGSYLDSLDQPTSVHGFLLRGGRYVRIDVSDGITLLSDVNDSGRIVGTTLSAAKNGIGHGFVLRGATGRRTEIDVPGAASTAALGINDRGQVVGSYANPAASGGPTPAPTPTS